jgi:hypothetical protein
MCVMLLIFVSSGQGLQIHYVGQFEYSVDGEEEEETRLFLRSERSDIILPGNQGYWGRGGD